MKRMTLLIAPAMATLILSGCAGSTVFNVNTTLDLFDSNPGDGSCATFGGQCSLRAAIQEANAATQGSNIVINLTDPGVYSLSLDANGSDGFIITLPTKVIRINGCCSDPEETTIEPTITSRIFSIQGGATTLERLRLTGGFVSGKHGGAILVSGDSELFIDQCILEGNQANVNISVGGRGGAIYVEEGNVNVLGITDSIIRNNTASFAGVGGAGGVDSHAATHIANTLFQDNEGNGGGLRLRKANAIGGPAVHEITRSTFHSNSSENSGGGGGVQIGIDNNSLIISNSTFSANESTGAAGAGATVFSGDVEIRHSTFTKNNASGFQGDALRVGEASEVRLRNNLIAQNGLPGDREVFCQGTDALILEGFNLIDLIDEDCDFLDDNPVDKDFTGPVNGEFSSYSEDPIGHYPLQSDSPAIDHGPATCGPTDQIGNPRNVDGDGGGGPRCDTGAIEFQLN